LRRATREGAGAERPGGEQSEQENRAIPPLLDVTRLTPSPPVAPADAAEAIRACYGLAGELTRLPGEADDNFLLAPASQHSASQHSASQHSASQHSGGQRYVVKFAHLHADPAVVGVQVRVLHHIETTAPKLPVPRVLKPLEPAAPGGQPWAVVPDGPLRGRVVHALSYLDGRLLRSVKTDSDLRRAMGGTLAGLGRALRGFDDPLVRRPLLWDLAQLPQLRPLAAERPPSPRTTLLQAQLARLIAQASPRLAALRTQLLHNDFSPDNTLISADGRAVSGIIDFGDVTVTALVNDVAIAVANLLGDGDDGDDLLGPGLDLIAGYHAVTPLTAAELGLLPDLILGRVVARIIISEWRAERFPANRGYVLRNTPRAWEQLDRLLSIGGGQFAARIQEATRA
jgi:hydroxylysine kinase